ncbi:MAG: DUF4011 domain-containing protein [Pirellulales bacterium]|nr:DUF4011 domain-containing protein [Pirellulales bacterium]
MEVDFGRAVDSNVNLQSRRRMPRGGTMPDRVLSRIDEWRSQLLDLSKRNRLINCRVDRTGAIRLEEPAPSMLWRILVDDSESMIFVRKLDLIPAENDTDRDPADGESPDEAGDFANTQLEGEESIAGSRRVPDLDGCRSAPGFRPNQHLLTALSDKALATRLSRLSLNAKTSLSEQGINILYLAFGLLHWYESPDSDVCLQSPLILVPVVLDRSGPERSWALTASDDGISPNYSLTELLKNNFNVVLPELPDDGFESGNDRLKWLNTVREAVTSQPRWTVDDDAVLGVFSFQKLAMWQDLRDNKASIAEHPLCRAIAGDENATAGASGSPIPGKEAFDEQIHPAELHTVLDCDSSQLEAILAVRAGHSLVLDGPPGTGKSQTIANIIAECLAADKTILFVSEKSAALEVVKRRLDQQKLGDFCLECHSHKVSRKVVVAELGRCLKLPVERFASQQQNLDRLYSVRTSLNQYVQALHVPRGTLQWTAFRVHGLVAELDGAPNSQCPLGDVLSLDIKRLSEMERAIEALAACENVIDAYESHPWRNCRLKELSLIAQDDLEHTFNILVEALTQIREPLTTLEETGLVTAGACKDRVEAELAATSNLLQLPELPKSWLAEDPAAVAQRIEDCHRTLAEYESIQRAIPQFTAEAVKANLEELSNQIARASGAWCARARSQGELASVRSRHHHFRGALQQVESLRATHNELRQTTRELINAIGLSMSGEPPIGQLVRLARIGRAIADTGLMKRSWFDNARRSVLRQAAAEGKAHQDACHSIRQELEPIVTSLAFEAEGARVCEEAKSFRPFWRRLLGPWREFRWRASRLYQTPAPRTARDMLWDLHRLGEYHARRAALRTYEAQYSAELWVQSDGCLDWDSLLIGCEAIEALQRETRIPERLVASLTTDNGLDRERVAIAVGQLEAVLSSHSDQLKSLSDQFDLSRIGPDRKAFLDCGPSVVDQVLSDGVSALQRQIEADESILRLLKPECDVLLSALPAALERLGALAARYQQLVGLLRQLKSLGVTMPSMRSPEWAESRIKVACLRQLLAQFDGLIPPAVVSIACDRAFRDRTRIAVRECAAILVNRVTKAWMQLEAAFDLEVATHDRVAIRAMSLDDLVEWVRHRINDLPWLREWLTFREAAGRLEALGISQLTIEATAKQIPARRLLDAFHKRLYRLWLTQVYATTPVLRQFNIDDHERLLTEYRTADRAAIANSYKRLRERLLSKPDRPHLDWDFVPASSELGILTREVEKKRRHMSLRKLFEKTPSLLMQLKPCLMMSPLAVSTFLNSESFRFDVVIFDEASQVRPFDAVGAVYRGKQLVVAGDQKQLPPTTFFDRLTSDDGSAHDEDSDEVGSLADFESVLDVCRSVGLPRWQLRWHYRSRREPLIAFANHHVYGNTLLTFPSVYDTDEGRAVKWHPVQEGRWRAGTSGGYNAVEARETAQLILRHFIDFPDKSLGVITFNQRQQIAVLDELERLQDDNTAQSACSNARLAERLNGTGDEPFFVKNLENVQGDERDCIVLSVGYGFDDQNKFAMRFGPLNMQGGERRLNVAVTRARESVTVVSSIRAHDIDLSRTKSRGAELLRAYLDFAERGTQALAAAISDDGLRDFDSPFEESVAAALRTVGLDVRSQVGCAKYRIDLAIVHPQEKGRYLLGVECDGASYHSSVVARDRDRLRQEILTGLGWQILRIWSTDWIRNPQRQVARVLSAYEAALKAGSGLPLSATDVESAPEQPRLFAPNEFADESLDFDNIDDVADCDIESAILAALRRYGQTSPEDLVKAVARALGFQRAGRRIQERVERQIWSLKRANIVASSDSGALSVPRS